MYVEFGINQPRLLSLHPCATDRSPPFLQTTGLVGGPRSREIILEVTNPLVQVDGNRGAGICTLPPALLIDLQHMVNHFRRGEFSKLVCKVVVVELNGWMMIEMKG